MSQEIDNKTESTSVLQLKTLFNVSKIQINTVSARANEYAMHCT